MPRKFSLKTLWDSATPIGRVFNPDDFSRRPEAVKRYLEHAIAPHTSLASAVRLTMHGELKLKTWMPFTAEQVICWEHGLIWSATAWMNGLPVVGADRILDGVGEMKWKLLGLFPVMIGTGPDITRSAVGRLQIESMWLPSVLCGDDVSWQAEDLSRLRASFVVQGEKAELDFTIEPTGQLKTAQLPRWGNPDGKEHHYVDFGAIVEKEDTFCGYTIPTQLRVGWYFGTEHFEPEGEFFRATIEDAVYR